MNNKQFSADMNTLPSQTFNDSKTWEKRERANKCELCDFVSVRPYNLRRHWKMHTGEKTHTGEKSHICNQCNYASALAADLGRHLKTLTIEKP